MDKTKLKGLTPDTIAKLEMLEAKIGTFTINSAYRTPEYNKKVGGVNDSQHVQGRAVDISRASYGESPEQLEVILKALGFTGYGVYDTFVHIDTRPTNTLVKWDERTKKKVVKRQTIKG